MKRKLAILGAILLAAFIFTYEGNTYQAHALDEEDLAWIAEAGQALRQIVEDSSSGGDSGSDSGGSSGGDVDVDWSPDIM